MSPCLPKTALLLATLAGGATLAGPGAAHARPQPQPAGDAATAPQLGRGETGDGTHVVDFRNDERPHLRVESPSEACATLFADIDAAWHTLMASPEVAALAFHPLQGKVVALERAYDVFGCDARDAEAAEAAEPCAGIVAARDAAFAGLLASDAYAQIVARPELWQIDAKIDAGLAADCYLAD